MNKSRGRVIFLIPCSTQKTLTVVQIGGVGQNLEKERQASSLPLVLWSPDMNDSVRGAKAARAAGPKETDRLPLKVLGYQLSAETAGQGRKPWPQSGQLAHGYSSQL